jgi:hypothetical protein
MAKIVTSIHGMLAGLDRAGRLLLGGRLLGSGDPKPAVTAVYVNTAASTTITNTTSETAFDTSHTIPANSLQPGDTFHVEWKGIAPSTNGTDTLTIRFRIGGVAGTLVCAGTATDVANDNIFAGRALITFRTVGAAGTMIAHAEHTEAPAASGTAAMSVVEAINSTAVDTTAAITLNVTAQWSVANAGNQVRLDTFIVRRM